MRLVIISDTHGFHRHLGELGGDVLIHCGDLTGIGEMSIVEDFAEWAEEQDFEHRIFVPGNHDFCFDGTRPNRFVPGAAALLREKGITFLFDQEIEIGGVRFYGSPWVPWLQGWAFYNGGPREDKFVDAPTDIDVLITHGPAYGILDRVTNGEHVGDPTITKFIKRCGNLVLHAHGHIHEDRGVIDPNSINPLPYTAVNAAICDRQYIPNGRPVYIDLNPADGTVEVVR